MTQTFQPDYRHLVDAVCNRRPARLPLYEHMVNDEFIEKFTGRPLISLRNDADRSVFLRAYCDFWKQATYDTVSFEICVTSILPDGGAIMGGKAGPIQSESDFNNYPWDELPGRFWSLAAPWFEALGKSLPAGMKAVGGIGNGLFEISEDLVGYEHLAYMLADDLELFARLYQRIGDLLANLWGTFLARYAEPFCVCRIGDDMGYKSATMLAPQTLLTHVVPQYRRLVGMVRKAGQPFLLHSCGRIFDIMDALIDTGINAKHSNEDQIAPFDEWITRYGRKIGLLGGIDLDVLVRSKPNEVRAIVLEMGTRFRNMTSGYALGSGNSIPDYVPVENYQAMIEAAEEIRKREGQL